MTRGQRLILATGATGGQGGSTARAALNSGLRVRALVRPSELESPQARALASAGAELVVGDFSDADSLRAAMVGVNAVFSMQPDGAPTSDFAALVDAAHAANVEQYVHSTVSGVRAQELVLDQHPDDPKRDYWLAKIAQERTVRAAPFRYKTYLRPSLVLDNLFLRAAFMYPRLATHGDFLIAMEPTQPIAYVTYETIGKVAAAAFDAPERFDGAELELADVYISHADLAAALGEVTGKIVTVTSVDERTAVEMGLAPRVAHSHRWLTEVGYPARPAMLAPYGIEPIELRSWLASR